MRRALLQSRTFPAPPAHWFSDAPVVPNLIITGGKPPPYVSNRRAGTRETARKAFPDPGRSTHRSRDRDYCRLPCGRPLHRPWSRFFGISILTDRRGTGKRTSVLLRPRGPMEFRCNRSIFHHNRCCSCPRTTELLGIRLAVRHRCVFHPDRLLFHRENVEENRLIRLIFPIILPDSAI